MDNESMEMLSQMDEELQMQRQHNKQMSNTLQSHMGMFNTQEQENLIRYQLDLNDELDRIYHLLKGDKLTYDDQDRLIYKEQDNADLKPLNEFGVQMIMNVLAFYLNRNTILSNYDEETIIWKVKNFGFEICDLIFNRYEDMMITVDIPNIIEKLTNKKVSKLPNGKYVLNLTYDDGYILYEEVGQDIMIYVKEILENHIRDKIKMYPIIVNELVDTVHSCYLRAYNGGERDSLRTARTVTQTEPLMRNTPMSSNRNMNMNVKPKFSLLKPSTWA